MFLVTGANGQLGNELKLLLQDKAVYVDRAELDITDAEAVQAYAAKQKWEAIINCAAYTAVDKAESDAETAEKINVLGPENLAKTGIPLIQISTDYVFDGRNCRPYNEDDEPHPQSVYGRTKLAGEQAVLQNAATAVIVRTAWLYSTFGNNFVKTMIRLGKEREKLSVVFDQIGTPTYAGDLAKAIMIIIDNKTFIPGIYNFSNEGVCSWYDFTKAIHRIAGIRTCEVLPIEGSEYPAKATRPFYSVMNKKKIKETYSVSIPYWENSLVKCINLLMK